MFGLAFVENPTLRVVHPNLHEPESRVMRPDPAYGAIFS